MNRLAGVKKAQVTLFVILAIIIVAGVAIFFYIRSTAPIPAKLQPVENYYLGCISDIAAEGAMILGEQGGYIRLPGYEIGSGYMPSGSQISFFGSIIPYWFYISGNNIQKTQNPSITDMENQLADYINENIAECTFEGFTDYSVEFSEAESRVTIYDSFISVEVSSPLTIEYQDITKTVAKHSTNVKTDMGSLFKKAEKIFDVEQRELFLEDYVIDTITLNGPTTGTELTCSPKIWFTETVSDNIKNAMADNIRTIKIKGDYYSLAEKKNQYFVRDIGEDISEQVTFFYDSSFPTRLEIEPEENGVMKAMPVGLQQGLGILGFCYVPYHFIYSAAFPVIVQVMDDDEMFQFSTVVVIDKNQPRESYVEEPVEGYESELCKDIRKIETVTVFTHDPYQTPIESRIRFKCLNTVCDVGDTEIEGNNAMLSEKFPQCVNGFVIASAEGYTTARQQISTNEPSIIDLTLYPYHEIEIDLGDVGENLKEDERVFLSFVSDEQSSSIIYPAQKTIELADGVYDIKATLFKKGELTFEEETTEKCVTVPATGLAGLFGVEREECYDVTIPEQTMTEILAGGGKTTITLDEYELSSSSRLMITIPEFNVPASLEELQGAYALAETSELYVLLV